MFSAWEFRVDYEFKLYTDSFVWALNSGPVFIRVLLKLWLNADFSGGGWGNPLWDLGSVEMSVDSGFLGFCAVVMLVHSYLSHLLVIALCVIVFIVYFISMCVCYVPILFCLVILSFYHVVYLCMSFVYFLLVVSLV